MGLYRRALVNLLIATTANIRKYPHKKIFAQECIDLIAQVRRNFGPDDPHGMLSDAEEHAIRTLGHIDRELKEWREIQAKQAEARAEKQKQGQTEVKTEDEEVPLVVLQTEGDVVEWHIEGAFTDLSMGYARRKDTEEAEAQAKTRKSAESGTPPPSLPPEDVWVTETNETDTATK